MKVKLILSPMQKYSVLFTLILITLFALGMIGIRFVYSKQLLYAFLLWNLFLAWLPVAFAFLALRTHKRPLPTLAASFMWLLFFPNAPYLVTDLIHLHAYPPVPLWYDLILLFTFAVLGLFLGLVSLYMMHGLIDGYFGRLSGWLFVLAALGAGGLGVFIGRFLRWNSWDLFTQPLTIVNDILANLSEPRTLVISGLLALLLLFAYLIFTIGPKAY
ncbi:MAG: DUF1361 domain-containing protein [Candidatus Promineifilaceae bacterium]